MTRVRLGGNASRIAVFALLAALAGSYWAYRQAGLAWRVRRRYPIGIDVSHHQGSIDWRRVRDDGISFAFIKATEGATWTDPAFATNWSEAQRQGVARGAYHFFTFCTPGDQQARHFLEVVPQDPAALPAVVDLEMEGNCSRRPPADELGGMLAAFLAVAEPRLGHDVMLYVTEDFLEQYGSVTPARELFIRALGPEPPRLDQRAWTYWQFDDQGRVDGISTPVDLDAFAGDRRVEPGQR